MIGPDGLPQSWIQTLGDIAPLIGALASIATTAIGFLIFREAQSIRLAEWRARGNERWTNFNDMTIRYEYTDRWGDIIHGKVSWDEITQKDKMFIYTFLNVLSHQFNISNKRLLPRRYMTKSVGDNIMYFAHIWDDLHRHLRNDGWSETFLDALDAHVREKWAEAEAQAAKTEIPAGEDT